MKFDYILQASIDGKNYYPCDAFNSAEKAANAALDLSKISDQYTEIVYEPEADMDINFVVCRCYAGAYTYKMNPFFIKGEQK